MRSAPASDSADSQTATAQPAPRPVPDVLAAVDLGSNSFHMVVARYSHGQLVIIDRLREMVRLAAGVEENGRIDKDVAARALACLQRFGQRLRDMHADSVRVVGTNALRLAHRKQAFLERAREALGHPIEIIAGMEEARLIYSRRGAHHAERARASAWWSTSAAAAPSSSSARGSTPLELESLQMGCVVLSERFFRDGKISAKRIERRAPGRAPGARAGAGGLPAPRLGTLRRQLRHRARHRRGDPRARPAGAHHHARRASSAPSTTASRPGTCAS